MARRISYLAARVLKMNYGNMFKTAQAVSKKCDKSFADIIKDMVHCGMKYQAGYYDYQEFEFYLLDEKQRETYLTRGKNNAIILKYNNKKYMPVFDDKIAFNKVFGRFLNRDWLDLNEANVKQFVKFIKKHHDIIAKPADGVGGAGVEKYSIKNPDDVKEIAALYEILKKKKQNLIETFILQHPDMNVMYEGSVNTLRMFTFCKEGKGCFLQAILKIGNGGVVDNFSSGGMYTFVDDDGIVEVPAIDKDDQQYTRHPITGTKIIGFEVPMFAQAVDLVKKAAEVVPQVAYIGWDVAISEDGPVIIEGNCFPGVFQKRASFSKDKTGIIPRYREYMDV
ncbi:MAG: hexapeptide transferase [Clostridia bacterium]|nr:hexapeptide transferase [Clostridia bacterium]